MDEKLEKIIKESSFTWVKDDFYYLKAKSRPSGKHFFIAEDRDEVTVVTSREKVREVDVAGQNTNIYTFFALSPTVPFYTVGFLAAVSSAIAAGGMNILIVSTYSKDYLGVQKEHAAKARAGRGSWRGSGGLVCGHGLAGGGRIPERRGPRALLDRLRHVPVEADLP